MLPVSDLDKAKDFYQALGWRLDANYSGGPDYRVVQLTPPGSALAEGLSGPSLADYASVKAPAGRPYERPHPAKRPGRGVGPGR